MSTGTAGVGRYFYGGNRRVTPRNADQRVEAPTTPKETPEQKRSREWDEACNRNMKQIYAERDRNLALRQQEEQRKQAAVQRQKAKAQWAMNEMLIDTAFAQAGLTPEEIAEVTRRLIDSGRYNPEGAAYEAANVIANRQPIPKPNNGRIAAVRDIAFDYEWNEIQRVLSCSRSESCGGGVPSIAKGASRNG